MGIELAGYGVVEDGVDVDGLGGRGKVVIEGFLDMRFSHSIEGFGVRTG